MFMVANLIIAAPVFSAESSPAFRQKNGLQAYVPPEWFLKGYFIAREKNPDYVFGPVQDFVGALGGNYILKPPSGDYPEMPQNEHLTMRLAEAFNLNVVPSSLVRLRSGELSYVTRRVDREANGKKVHMLDMFQITEAFDKYRSSMEKVEKRGRYKH